MTPAAAPADSRRPSATAATALLVAVTAMWGGTFVLVRDVVAVMPVLPFLFWRFLIAALVLVAVRPRALRSGPALRGRGIGLGVLLGGGYVLQTFGLQHTSATVSGFITGMFVVFTPLIAWRVLRTPIPVSVWLAVALAAVGLGLISLDGLSLGLGEVLTLGCAVLFAGQIVGLSVWSTPGQAHALTTIQLGTVALLCLAASPLAPGTLLPPSGSVWLAIGFLAIAATALAFLAQAWAQTVMSAPRAAIVLTMEPVFAGLFGVTLGGDELTARIVAGGACIVAAMYLVEFGPRLSARAGRTAPGRHGPHPRHRRRGG